MTFASTWAENVVEAYRATYRHTNESSITVAAIQFNDGRLATPARRRVPGMRRVE